jgi:hypothetical protein
MSNEMGGQLWWIARHFKVPNVLMEATKGIYVRESVYVGIRSGYLQNEVRCVVSRPRRNRWKEDTKKKVRHSSNALRLRLSQCPVKATFSRQFTLFENFNRMVLTIERGYGIFLLKSHYKALQMSSAQRRFILFAALKGLIYWMWISEGKGSVALAISKNKAGQQDRCFTALTSAA